MNLAELLTFADIQHLHCMANAYDCKCNKNSKHELIQSILSMIHRRGVLEGQLDQLSVSDLRFLNSLLFDSTNAFTVEELLARSQLSMDQDDKSSPKQPREVISAFKQWGWLIQGHAQQNKYVFHMPQDLKARIQMKLKQKLQQTVLKCDEPSVFQEQFMHIHEDIMRFLHYVNQQPTLALTNHYCIPQRHLSNIFNLFTHSEKPIKKEGWRFGYGRMFKQYPNRFSFIYDYCCHYQYSTDAQRRLALTESGKEWLAAQCVDPPYTDPPSVETDLKLYVFWLHLYRPPIPHIFAIVQWINQLADHWVTVSSLEQTLCPFIRPFYYDSPESILKERILQMMYYLGLIRIGHHEMYGQIVKMSKRGEQLTEAIRKQKNRK
jgi:hypothetical protein